MKHVRMVGLTVAAAILMSAALFSCGPSGNDYLGKWRWSTSCWTGSRVDCVLEISKTGDSFVMKSVGDTCSTCKLEGIFALTPEGTLKGGEMGQLVLAFDKAKDQVLLNAGGEIANLDRVR